MKLIHFTAEWCHPCKMMKPIVDDVLSERPDLEYIAIDIDKDTPIAVEYGVLGVPTFIIEDDGVIVRRIQGAMTKNQFVSVLND